jgi:hypothetical protein
MSFEIAEGIYLGLSNQFDSYLKIVDKKLRLNPGDYLITSHYSYNAYYGFNTEKYFNSSPGVRFTIHKRDKYSRTHLALEVAFGHRSSGFYLAVSETFQDLLLLLIIGYS